MTPFIPSSASNQAESTRNPSSFDPVGANDTSETRSTKTSIIGPATGTGTALVAILILALIYFCRRHRRQQCTALNRNMMVRQPQDQNVEIEMRNRPDSGYMSTYSASVTALNTGIEMTGKIGVQTERQKEIEERMQHLVALLDTLESQSQIDSEASIGKVRERIKRLSALKEGEWAREVSDVKPVEMM
ncbi:hypothetical protein VNI00_015133 [Paramarasmius palmivorus]|uniref:Uncharacterized protein n=1 Tax=Paramarasmius palmivorus TaxID=297713 RepID=A0AAW0BQZ4_9AGAR